MKTVFLGNYWQTNAKEKEPIEWIVLQEDAEKMYVISKYSLDCVFEDGFSDLEMKGWENSFIRRWLNDIFLNDAFSEAEQNMILLSTVKTSSAIRWNSKLDGGKGVQDKLFLPSRSEAILYFDSVDQDDIVARQKRITRPTGYAYQQGCCMWPLKYDETRNAWRTENHATVNSFFKNDNYETDTPEMRWASKWILRCAQHSRNVVCEDGDIGIVFTVEYNFLGVRPAMWIKK